MASPPLQQQINTTYSPILNEDELLEVVGPLSAPFSPLAMSTLLDQGSDNDFQLDEDLELKTRKPKKKRRRDRNRPWHELARLQLESDNLEQELQIQLAHASKEAKEALHERNKNAQLKAILKESVQDVHQLEQNAVRQLSELVGIVPTSSAMSTRVLPFDTTDRSIFKSMAHSVDDQYKDMGRVLRRAEIDGLSSEVVEGFVSRTKSVYTGNKDSEILKFRTRIVTPFTKNTLERALWRVLEDEGGVTFEPSQDQDACELIVPFGSSSRVVIQKHEVFMDGFTCVMRMVIKQFVENHRVVQVWKALADWAVGPECKVQTQEYGWGYIQPLDGDSTVTVGCILMTATVEGRISSGRCEDVKSLTNLYQKKMMSRLQTLENQTMDEIVQEKNAAELDLGLVCC